MLIINNF